jgi:heat shock protein HslJ
MAEASTLANYDNNPRFRSDGAIEFGSTTPDWSTNTRLVTHWDGTQYGPPEPDTLLDAWAGWWSEALVSSATLSPDGSIAILDVRLRDAEGQPGPSDLWFSRRLEAGWSDPKPLEGGVNTDAFENFVVFSPDGSEIHFVRGFHLYWRISTDAAIGAGATSELAGTSWRLVEFEGGDDTLLVPDDRGKYTIAFGTDGRVSIRVDCNRGAGTWSSEGPSQLSFGPLALTRAMCPPGSMHDRIVRDWEYVRSYVLDGGHLFLSLMADGGIYEYEPTPPGID